MIMARKLMNKYSQILFFYQVYIWKKKIISPLFNYTNYTHRSMHHNDESRLIQGVLMITNMMTKSPREWFQDWVKNHSRIKRSFRNDFKIESRTIQEESRIKNNQDQDSRLKIQESRKDSIKISTKKFFKTLSSTWSFYKIFYQRVFTHW